MDDGVRTILRDTLRRHGRELVDEPRRCETVLAENFPAGAKLEIRALMAALTQHVPQRLAGMPAGTVTSAAIDNSAKSLAAYTGLRDDVARWAVAAWAFGLDLPIAEGPVGQEPSPSPSPPPPPPTVTATPRQPNGRKVVLGAAAAVAVLIVIVVFEVGSDNQTSTNTPPPNPAPATAADAINWKVYKDQRFGTTLQYPNDFNAGQPEHDQNAQYVTFTSPDGAKIEFSALDNRPPQTPNDTAKHALDWFQSTNITLVQKNQSDRVVTLEGNLGDQKHYYVEHVFSRSGQVLNSTILTCPQNLTAKYSKIATAMWQSFFDQNP
jgi:hypothetical protein